MLVKACLFVTFLAVASAASFAIDDYIQWDHTIIAIVDAAIQRSCILNAGTEQRDKYVEATNTTQQCMDDLGAKSKTLALESRADIMKYLCAKPGPFRSCIYPLLDAMADCSSPTLAHVPNYDRDVMDAIIDFNCQNDGEKLKDVMDNTGDCITENFQKLKDCFEPTDLVTSTVELDCNRYAVLQKCLVQELKTCRQPVTGMFAEEIFKVINQAARCKSVEVSFNTTGCLSSSNNNAKVIAVDAASK